MKHSSYLTSVNAPDTGAEEHQYVWGNGEEIHAYDGSGSGSAPAVVDADTLATLGKGYPVRFASPGQNLIALTLRDLCYHGTNGDYTVL